MRYGFGRGLGFEPPGGMGAVMATTLEGLPDQVRAHVVKMRELIGTIENSPVSEVVTAIVALKAEVELLVADANAASGRRM
jgi:hypothetical protein